MEGCMGSLRIALFALAATAGCSNDGSGRSTRPTDAADHADARGPSGDAGGTTSLRFFTGTVEGTDARIGVVAAKHHARLYFCGGDSTYTMLSRWVPATIDSSGNLTPDPAAEMGWVVTGTISSDAVDGSLRPGDAASYRFHAAPVADGTIAGLYEGTSPCGKVGVIVSQGSSGESPVAQGACITSSGSGSADIHQVNPVGPLERDADETISVEVSGTSETLRVTPALVAD
jgi:hypothetical protein